MKRVILLDADIPIFLFAAVNQKDVQWDEGDESIALTKPFELVCDQIDDYIDSLYEQLNADRMIVALSEPDRAKNWRRGILPTYKANRTGASPEFRQPLSDYLESKYECFKRPTLEGDDVLGILATNPDIVHGKKVIVSIDKDMQTIPTRKHRDSENWLFNPNKDKKPHRVSEQEADWFWMFQTLTGDSTDNYKGCPSIGPKRALDILGPADEGYLDLWFSLVVDTYNSKGLTGDDALVQAQVARICRAEDYDYYSKEVIPWSSD